MALDQFKSHAALVTVVAVALAAAVGCWAFIVSLRPCRLSLDPGTVVSYRLTTECREILADGSECLPLITEQTLDLVCIGTDNEVALLTPSRSGVGDEVTILSFASDGSARRLDADAKPSPDGKTLGFFDFNLLPLPKGSEQNWDVSLVYALLPPEKRVVHGRVKRKSNSAVPEFELRLGTVEWLNAQSRYLQVKNLVCTYRFDTGRGVVQEAVVRCDTGVEREDGSHRFRLKATLGLAALERAHGDAGALRDLALASAETQDALAERRYERVSPLLARLAAAGDQHPRLRAIAQRLVADAGRLSGGGRGAAAPGTAPRRAAPPEPTPAPPDRRGGPGWAVQVATLPDRARAERLGKSLADDGYPILVAASGSHYVVRVGPFASREKPVHDALRKRFPRDRPLWVKVSGDPVVASAPRPR